MPGSAVPSSSGSDTTDGGEASESPASAGPVTKSGDLGGEPLKVEAQELTRCSDNGDPAQSLEGSLEGGAPTTPVKLELPVKLLRLDATSMQLSFCEQQEPGIGSSTSAVGVVPERSLSLDDDRLMERFLPLSPPDVWASPLMRAGQWAPTWPLAVSPGAGLEGLESPPGLPPARSSGAGSLETLPEGATEAEGGVLDQGSALHVAGKCRPCAWYWKPGSCQNADSCSYCHLCGPGELKARKKTKVAMMRLGIVTPKAKGATDYEATGNVLRLSSLL